MKYQNLPSYVSNFTPPWPSLCPPPFSSTKPKRQRFKSPASEFSPPNRSKTADFPKVLSKKCSGGLGAVQPRDSWWSLRDIEAPKSSSEKPVTVWIALTRMWSLIGDDKWIIFLAIGALSIAAVSEISMPRILAASVFSANSGESAAFFRSSRVLILLLIVSGICSGLRSGCFAIANTILVKRLRGSLFASLIFQDISFFDTEMVGSLTSRLGADCQRLSHVIGNDIHLIIRNVIQGTGALINLLSLSWPLTLPTLVICSVLAIIFSFYGRYQKRAAMFAQEFNACANNVAQETLSLMRTVRAYGTEGEELGRYKQWLDELGFVSIRESVAYGFWNMSFLSLYRSTQVLAVLLGGMCIMNSHASAEQLTKYILYCEWLIYATWRVVDNSSSLLQSIGASEKVFQLMDLLPADQFFSKGVKLQRLMGNIRFVNVSFHYPSRITVPILDHLNLSVQANEVVAIVGLSGSGKSTLVNLMLRLYEPVSGQIYIDGLPLKELDIRWLREKIGFVGQDPHLFNMDIESNIKYGCPRDVEEEDIEWAAKQANAHEFISSLQLGYQTIVDGNLLSGGQKQRIAIARAILRDPAILVLDEATSALDAESEYNVKGVLHALRNESRAKRTVIIIAHRLSTIKTADRIAVMDGGRIVEMGDHTELLLKGGFYSRLVRAQAESLA
ncbi:ABC transporter B family member 26, chloroplastic isoform X1 [Herrania umbratica]|uniref:ABC transporter B family member 26, chloroplastic isoform X1 n=2 Tax=Herrania umbratica TaxID=108875 RepID=A0A6J1BHJ0_9ROSI|nr:ABC transporter B family member 26, chloroplastic isoform X1 [Herrania umbratica]